MQIFLQQILNRRQRMRMLVLKIYADVQAEESKDEDKKYGEIFQKYVEDRRDEYTMEWG